MLDTIRKNVDFEFQAIVAEDDGGHYLEIRRPASNRPTNFSRAISAILDKAVQAASDRDFAKARLLFQAAGDLKERAEACDDSSFDTINQEFEAAGRHMPEGEW